VDRAVRIDSEYRGRDLGKQMFEAIVAHFRASGATTVRTLADGRETGVTGFLQAAASRPRPCKRWRSRCRRTEQGMKVEQVTLPKKYHDAVEHWRRHWIPITACCSGTGDKYFPKDEAFCLCAKMELARRTWVQIGDIRARRSASSRRADRGGGQAPARDIRAQASTEFGSIQQHSATLHRAQDDDDRFW